MPEGSEIKYMTDNLQYIKGKSLDNLKINKNSKYKKYLKNYYKIKKVLPLKIKDIFSIGKRIFITFRKSNFFFILNMGLIGDISTKKDGKHNSLSFILLNAKNFYMNDTIKYGSFSILQTGLDEYIYEMGFDPLDSDITFNNFYKRFIQPKKSKQPLALKLLDQKIFAGMGNYMRAEVLYDSQVDPFCKFNNMNKKLWKRIFISYTNSMKGVPDDPLQLSPTRS